MMLTFLSKDKGTFITASQRLSAIRLWLVVCAVFVCAACTDGYPGKHPPVLTPAEMTQTQRLKQLNDIGRQSYLDTRWKYKLNDSCDLKVSRGRMFSRKSVVVSLKQGQVVRSIDRKDKTHDIHLRLINSLVPLLETANWEDSVSFYTLVSHVQRVCASDERP